VKDTKLLREGIGVLRQNDKDIERLLPNPEEIISLLARYIQEIELFNEAYSLVGVKDTDELVIKHILDSLAPLGIIFRLMKTCAADGPAANSPADGPADNPAANSPADGPAANSQETCAAVRPQIADAGSGAGLPGIPLAIALSNMDFTLIERMGRRAGFLWNTKAILGLSNIAVEEGELEKTAQGRFHLVTFRAFKPLEPKLLKALFRACAEGGVIAAYKGRREKIEEEMAPLAKPAATPAPLAKPAATPAPLVKPASPATPTATPAPQGGYEAIPYSVPFLDEERHIVVIKKYEI